MNTEQPNYEGKFVFIEQTNPKSTYGNGEYFCVRQTPGTLYVLKPIGGYGGHTLEAKPLIGSEAWRVVEAWRDDENAQKAAQDMIEFGELPKTPGFKLNWVEYVYSECGRNGRSILRLLQSRNNVSVRVAQSDAITVRVPAGVTKINLDFTS